jgi:hypothetical protein
VKWVTHCHHGLLCLLLWRPFGLSGKLTTYLAYIMYVSLTTRDTRKVYFHFRDSHVFYVCFSPVQLPLDGSISTLSIRLFVFCVLVVTPAWRTLWLPLGDLQAEDSHLSPLYVPLIWVTAFLYSKAEEKQEFHRWEPSKWVSSTYYSGTAVVWASTHTSLLCPDTNTTNRWYTIHSLHNRRHGARTNVHVLQRRRQRV